MYSQVYAMMEVGVCGCNCVDMCGCGFEGDDDDDISEPTFVHGAEPPSHSPTGATSSSLIERTRSAVMLPSLGRCMFTT
jgi:hypothetical protein